MTVTAASLVGEISIKGASEGQDALSRVGKSADSAQQSLRTVKPASEDASDSLASRFSGAIQTGIGNLLNFGSQLGQTVFGLQNLASGAVNLAQSLLGPAAAAEQVQGSLEIFTGSAAKAKDELAALSDFAAQTPFETSSIDQAALKLQSVGINANDVIPYIKALGDGLDAAGRTSSADLGMISDSFVKIQTAGHLTTNVMDSFSASGIDAWSVLEKQTGKTHDELANLISSGLYPAKDAMRDLTQGIEASPLYKGQMANDANVFNGAVSTLKSTWDQALASFGSPVIKALEPVLQGITAQLGSQGFKDFAGSVGQGIVSVFQQIGTFVSQNVVPAFQHFSDIAKKVGDILNDEGLGILIASFQNLGSTISTSVSPILKTLGDLFKNIFSDSNIIGLAHDLEGKFYSVADGVDKLSGGIKALSGFFQSNSIQAQIVKDLLIGVGAALAAINIGAFLATLPELLTGLGVWAAEMTTIAIETLITAGPFILVGAVIAAVVAGIILAVQHWGEISSWLGGVWSAFSSWFMGILGAIGGFFAGVWNGIIEGLHAAWNFIISAIKMYLGFLWDVFTAPFRAIGALFTWLYDHNKYFKMLIDAIVVIVTAGLAWLNEQWSRFTGWLGNLLGGLKDMAGKAWEAVKNAVMDKVLALGTWEIDQWNRMTGWLGDQWGKFSGMMGNAWKAVSGVISGAWQTYIAGPIGDLWNRLSSTVGGWKDKAVDWGKNLIQGFVNGIVNMSQNVASAVGGIAQKVLEFLGFHSPTKEGPGREADQWAPNLIKMFNEGLQEGQPQLHATLNTMFSPMALMTQAPVSYLPAGAQVVPNSQSGFGGGAGQQQIIVQPAPVYIDGRVLMNALMPYLADAIRYGLGTKF